MAMRVLVQVMLLALVSAEEASKTEQWPGMAVPNWGKIFGAPANAYGGPHNDYKHHHAKKPAHAKKKEHEEAAVTDHEVATVAETLKAQTTHSVGYKVKKVAHEAVNGLPVCKGREYVEGSWKKLAAEPAKTFKCCSWDEGPGYWKKDTAKCMGASRRVNTGPAGSKFISIGGHGCMCDAKLDEVSKREMHVWTPETCTLPAFNANTFCEALGKGKIHIFGDSTMQQASATLMNMLIGGHREEKKHCTPQITFHLSDYLVAGNTDERGEVADFHKYDADIYVLGLGAWVHQKAKYADSLDRIAEKIKKRQSEPNPPAFVWKTISGAGCGKINQMSVDNHDPSYTYDLFPTYDSMAREKLTPLGVKFVDLSPLYLRGDAHPQGQKDCLHFCAPGPVDIFPRVLHHVLQEALNEE